MLVSILIGLGIFVAGAVVGFFLGQSSMAGMALFMQEHQFKTGRAQDEKGRWYKLIPDDQP